MASPAAGHDHMALAQMASVTDPWVMYLVLRRSRLSACGELELLEAAARAVIEASATIASGSEADGAALAAWASESERKVVLRARDGEWERLMREAPPALVMPLGGEPGLACLVPVRRSGRPALIKRLQVFDPDPEPDGGREPPLEDPGAARLVVAGELGMSVGKQMAQVGHGAYALRRASAEGDAALAGWADAGGRLVVEKADAQRFATLSENALVVIRDAGLTEIARGSRTVAVLAPTRHA